MDHQTGAQEDQRESEAKTGVFELLGDVDDDTEDSRPQTRAHVVDLADVAGQADREVVHHHAEVVEVQIPAVVAEEEKGIEEACTQDCPLLEQLILDEMLASAVFFPGCEDEEHAEADHQKGDEGRALVFGSTVGLEAEGQEDKQEGGHEEKRADYYRNQQVSHSPPTGKKGSIAYNRIL